MEQNESVLLEAHRLTHKDRKETYGHVLDDYSCVVGMFNEYRKHRSNEPLTAEDGVMFMVFVKIAREAHQHKRDNVTDGCGYFSLVQEIWDERERRGK